MFAIYGHPEAANLTYLGLYALQHRGQESAGIATSDGREIRCFKSMGHVADIFTPDSCLPCRATLAIGHTRYSTAGDTALLNAQPFSGRVQQGTDRGRAQRQHHQRRRTAARPGARGLHLPGFERYRSDSALGGPVARTDARRSAARSAAATGRRIFAGVPGARTASSSPATRTASGRWLSDRWHSPDGAHGLRLCLGNLRLRPDQRHLPQRCRARRDGLHRPGRHDARALRARVDRTPSASSSTCISRGPIPSSSAARSSNRARIWAACWPANRAVDADVVVPVPDSGVAAAIGYAAESGIPFRQALIRNHYVGRTFIEPSQAIRDFGVKLKLNPVRHLLEGKRVILVDDSIVRGTTSRKIVRMVRNAGAREVHLRISCPPTVSSCFYGVDTPSRERIDRRQSIRSRRSAASSKPTPSAIFRWAPCAKPWPTTRTNTATPATPATIPPNWSTSKNW